MTVPKQVTDLGRNLMLFGLCFVVIFVLLLW